LIEYDAHACGAKIAHLHASNAHLTSYFVVVGSDVWYVVVFKTRDDVQENPAVQIMLGSFKLAR